MPRKSSEIQTHPRKVGLSRTGSGVQPLCIDSGAQISPRPDCGRELRYRNIRALVSPWNHVDRRLHSHHLPILYLYLGRYAMSDTRISSLHYENTLEVMLDPRAKTPHPLWTQ